MTPKETLEHAHNLPYEIAKNYYNENAPKNLGVFQRCVDCSHILLKHTTKEDLLELNVCRATDEQGSPCACGEFK